MILLDSDVAIDILRGRPAAVTWFDSLPASEVIVLPGVVAMELVFGARNLKELTETRQWLAKCRTVWLDAHLCQKAYDVFVTVHLSNAIGVIDILVAQVALSLNVPLHTFNEKHFRVVPGLRTIAPYPR